MTWVDDVGEWGGLKVGGFDERTSMIEDDYNEGDGYRLS